MDWCIFRLVDSGSRFSRSSAPLARNWSGAVFIALIWLALSAQAKAQIWDGGSVNNNWSSALNWNPNVIPTNDGLADIIIGPSSRTTQTVDRDWSIRSLAFSNVTPGFNTVAASNGARLTVGAGGITNSSGHFQDIRVPVLLSSDQTWSSPVQSLAVGSSISQAINLNNHLLTVTGDVQLSNLVGDGQLLYSGPGTRTLRASQNYLGTVTITGGELQVGSDSDLGAAGGQIVVDGATLHVTSAPNQLDRPILIGPTGATLNGQVNYRGNITGPGVLRIVGVATFSGNNDLPGGVIVDQGRLLGSASLLPLDISGAGSVEFTQSTDGEYAGSLRMSGGVTASGTGVVVLSGNNSYGGNTIIGANIRLQLEGGNAIGDTSSLYVGGVLDLNGSNETVGPISSGGTALLGRILLGSGTLTANYFDPPQTTFEYGGSISGSGGFVKNGSATAVFRGANTYSGPTTINAGILRLESPQSISAASSVSLLGAAGAALELVNGAYSIGSLAGGGVSGGNVLLSSAQLTIGANNESTAYSGQISGNGSVTKTGTGTLTLGRANLYDGGTFLRGGTLSVSSSTNLGNATGALNFDGGTLLITSPFFTFTTRPITWGPNGGGFNIAPANGVFRLTQSLSGIGGFSKSGAGTLRFEGDQSYTGLTIIDGGTLIVPDTLQTSGAAISVEGSGILRAYGVIRRAVAGDGSVVADGPLQIGSLTSTEGFQLGGTLDVASHFVGLVDSDAAVLDGPVSIAGGTLASFNGIRFAGEMAGSGTINGEFENVGVVNGTNPAAPLIFAGVVSGNGSFLGNVRFDGLYSPGDGPATVALGDPHFANALRVEIGGRAPGTEHDQLQVMGRAELGGTLAVAFIDGFTPVMGDRFTLIEGGQLVGEFSAFNLPTLPAPLEFEFRSTADALVLAVVPEPSSQLHAALATFFLAALTFAGRFSVKSRIAKG